MKKALWLLWLSLALPLADACTAYGVINKDGSIMLAKNRDFHLLYQQKVISQAAAPGSGQQSYVGVFDCEQASCPSNSDYQLKMGINQAGLTVIETAGPSGIYPGAVLPASYGAPNQMQLPHILSYLLQTYTSVEQIIGELQSANSWFSNISPMNLLISDKQQIVLIEIGPNNTLASSAKVAYQIINQPGQITYQANTYLLPAMLGYNSLYSYNDRQSSINRTNRISRLMNYALIKHGQSIPWELFKNLALDSKGLNDMLSIRGYNETYPANLWLENSILQTYYPQNNQTGQPLFDRFYIWGQQAQDSETTVSYLGTYFNPTTQEIRVIVRIISAINNISATEQVISYQEGETSLADAISTGNNFPFNAKACRKIAGIAHCVPL